MSPARAGKATTAARRAAAESHVDSNTPNRTTRATRSRMNAAAATTTLTKNPTEATTPGITRPPASEPAKPERPLNEAENGHEPGDSSEVELDGDKVKSGLSNGGGASQPDSVPRTPSDNVPQSSSSPENDGGSKAKVSEPSAETGADGPSPMDVASDAHGSKSDVPEGGVHEEAKEHADAGDGEDAEMAEASDSKKTKSSGEPVDDAAPTTSKMEEVAPTNVEVTVAPDAGASKSAPAKSQPVNPESSTPATRDTDDADPQDTKKGQSANPGPGGETQAGGTSTGAKDGTVQGSSAASGSTPSNDATPSTDPNAQKGAADGAQSGQKSARWSPEVKGAAGVSAADASGEAPAAGGGGSSAGASASSMMLVGANLEVKVRARPLVTTLVMHPSTWDPVPVQFLFYLLYIWTLVLASHLDGFGSPPSFLPVSHGSRTARASDLNRSIRVHVSSFVSPGLERLGDTNSLSRSELLECALCRVKLRRVPAQTPI